MGTTENKTLLYVEDEHDTRVTVRNLLEGAGYYVFSCTNGRDALELLKRIKPPGVVLLDLMLPMMDGYAFLREKNNDSSISSIPVVVMSANPDLSQLRGVQGVIRKPFDITTLVRTVERYCGPADEVKIG